MEAVIRLGQRNRAVDGIDYSRSPSPQNLNFMPAEAFQDFAHFAPYLPPELHRDPLIAPFVYSIQHMFMPPVVHRSLATVYSDHDVRNRHYQELMHAYLHLTADRLADMSPCYIDFWRTYIPSMAFGPNGSLALLNAMVALAALHIAPLQADDTRGKLRAWEFYHLALQNHRQAPDHGPPDDWMLATSLILAHYEVRCPLRSRLTVVMGWRNHKDGHPYARRKEHNPCSRNGCMPNPHRTSLILLLHPLRHDLLSRNRQSRLLRRNLVEKRSPLSRRCPSRSANPACRRRRNDDSQRHHRQTHSPQTFRRQTSRGQT